MTRISTRLLTVAVLAVAGMVGAQAGDAYVSATVSGVVAPGVYGRINIGSAPPPPVINAQPLIITQPQMAIQQEPMYLYVPPGHAKNWRRYCGRYNACGHPVYFVNADNRGRYIRPPEPRYEHREEGRHQEIRREEGRREEGRREGGEHGRDHDRR